MEEICHSPTGQGVHRGYREKKQEKLTTKLHEYLWHREHEE